MSISITTPALLFPAISLLLLAYTNRFLAIGSLIRQLKANVNHGNFDSISRQIGNLKKRLNLIMQAMGVLSILFCTLAMIVLFVGEQVGGKVSFALSLFFMLTSLLTSLSEILMSSTALKIELEEIKIKQ